MKKYLKLDASGYVTGFGAIQAEMFNAIERSPGERVVEYAGAFPDSQRKWRYESGALVDAGPLFEPSYSDLRRASYPSTGEQLDSLWHAMDDGILPKVEPFFSRILAVKQTHPKTSN